MEGGREGEREGRREDREREGGREGRREREGGHGLSGHKNDFVGQSSPEME